MIKVIRMWLLWYVPVSIALLAATIFAAGFYSFVRGNIGEAVTGFTAIYAEVLSIAESQHTLEDVYLELIGEDVEAHKKADPP